MVRKFLQTPNKYSECIDITNKIDSLFIGMDIFKLLDLDQKGNELIACNLTEIPIIHMAVQEFKQQLPNVWASTVQKNGLLCSIDEDLNRPEPKCINMELWTAFSIIKTKLVFDNHDEIIDEAIATRTAELTSKEEEIRMKVFEVASKVEKSIISPERGEIERKLIEEEWMSIAKEKEKKITELQKVIFIIAFNVIQEYLQKPTSDEVNFFFDNIEILIEKKYPEIQLEHGILQKIIEPSDVIMRHRYNLIGTVYEDSPSKSLPLSLVTIMKGGILTYDQLAEKVGHWSFVLSSPSVKRIGDADYKEQLKRYRDIDQLILERYGSNLTIQKKKLLRRELLEQIKEKPTKIDYSYVLDSFYWKPVLDFKKFNKIYMDNGVKTFVVYTGPLHEKLFNLAYFLYKLPLPEIESELTDEEEHNYRINFTIRVLREIIKNDSNILKIIINLNQIFSSDFILAMKKDNPDLGKDLIVAFNYNYERLFKYMRQNFLNTNPFFIQTLSFIPLENISQIAPTLFGNYKGNVIDIGEFIFNTFRENKKIVGNWLAKIFDDKNTIIDVVSNHYKGKKNLIDRFLQDSNLEYLLNERDVKRSKIE